MFLPVCLWTANLFAIAFASLNYQTPFLNFKTASYDDGLLKPIEDIRSLDTSDHTTLTHPLYPFHSVRIRQNGAAFCDSSVKSYSGYLDIGARHLYFVFFESRNDPKTDDLILWTNGGPGCSSSLGLYMELGPCRVEDVNSTVYNPHSWNSVANIFFIDQPVGVGFSYAEFGEFVGTSEDAAKDISAFMRIFVDTFTEFKDRPFHLAGESYGGQYIPIFGAQIFDDNKKAAEQGLEPINLKSLVIGNGLTDTARMPTSFYEIQCKAASIQPFQDISQCVRMKKAIPRCERLIQESCIDVYDQMGCEAAASFCENELEGPFEATGRNIYDVSRPCEGNKSETLCYPITKTIADFLDRADIRESLGVDKVVHNYQGCSKIVMRDFVATQDRYRHMAPFFVAELLERGIDVLIYVGTYDMICNWIGNERFTLALQWSGQTQFVSQELQEWTIDNKKVGRTRAYGGLTFATIEGAGHMVPHDKPVEALELISRWLSKRKI